MTCGLSLPVWWELKPLLDLARSLEMCNFKAFWKEAESAEILKQVSGWQDDVRTFIAGVVATTYRSVSKSDLASLLNLKVEELDKFSKDKKWTTAKENKDLIIVSEVSFE